MLKKRLMVLFSIILCMGFSVSAETTESTTDGSNGSLADPVNFPNNEVSIAEKVWEEFAYGFGYNGYWEMDYLDKHIMPDETPEIYWYFPYFIEFCKEYDLTSYTPVGDFDLYELIVDDFEEYY
ncbi:MAG: hypothetical protein LBM93_03105, partial [Oscillospiraceae bacterium]|nr:hypothetical protein [Oscillospiraceae bacterium]